MFPVVYHHTPETVRHTTQNVHHGVRTIYLNMSITKQFGETTSFTLNEG